MLWACAQGAGHVSCRFAKLKAVTDCDVEPCWSVGSILSAGPYSGKQRRLSLAADWPGQSGPSSILEDNIVCSVGQLYPATASATHGHQLPSYPVLPSWND